MPSPAPEPKEAESKPTTELNTSTDKPDQSASPSPKEEESRKSARTKQKVEPQEWPSTETIEWDKLTKEQRDLYNEFDSKKETEIQDMVAKLQQGNAVYPIGRDRTFRRYWVFHSLPGLFVEDEELFIPDDYLQPVPQLSPQKAQTIGDEKSTSDKENESFEHVNNDGSEQAGGDTTQKDSVQKDTATDLQKESSVDHESVHEQIANHSKVSWGFYSCAEEVDALIEGLNSRGHREGPLKQALQEHRDRLVANLEKVPTDVLSVPQVMMS